MSNPHNSSYFHDIVKGRYGRKIAYANVEEVTEDNVVRIVGDCIGTFYFNRGIFSYLWNYYKGDMPIKYRTKSSRDDICNKIVENHAFEFVQFKVGQTYGEPVQFVSRRDDDAVNKAVDELNSYMNDARKHVVDVTSGEWQSATGTSFKAVQKKRGQEVPFRFVAPTPLNTFVIYSSITGDPILSVQELKDENGQVYRLCFSDTMEYRIQGGKLVEGSVKAHGFGGNPIVEYPNNPERISDIELVIDLLDAINNMQSNRMDAIEQFVQAWVKFVNCEIDEETFQRMKMMGALVVKSNNKDNKADVEVMTNELSQTESQVAKEDLWNNALSILAIPNKQSNTGGDTQGAVELRNGWDFSKTRAKLKDVFVCDAEKQLAKVVLHVLRVEGGIDLGISTRDFDVTINHSPTDNLVVKCQALQYLLQCGIHPLIAIKTVGLWGDAEKTFLMSQPYLQNLWKTIDDMAAQEKEAAKLLADFENAQDPQTGSQTMQTE